MKNATILLNGNEIGYLIHGQPIHLSYSFTKYKFLLFYNKLKLPWWQFWRCFSFKRATGDFQGITNAYAPEIILWGVKSYFNPFADKMVVRLKVNFFNLKEQKTIIHTASPSITNNQPIHITKIAELKLSPRGQLKKVQSANFRVSTMEMKLNIEPF